MSPKTPFISQVEDLDIENLHDLSLDIIMKQWGIESSTSNPLHCNQLFLIIYLEILFDLDSSSLVDNLLFSFSFTEHTCWWRDYNNPILSILSLAINPGETRVVFHVLQFMVFKMYSTLYTTFILGVLFP